LLFEVRDCLSSAPTRHVVLPDCGCTVFRVRADLVYGVIREFLAALPAQ